MPHFDLCLSPAYASPCRPKQQRPTLGTVPSTDSAKGGASKRQCRKPPPTLCLTLQCAQAQPDLLRPYSPQRLRYGEQGYFTHVCSEVDDRLQQRGREECVGVCAGQRGMCPSVCVGACLPWQMDSSRTQTCTQDKSQPHIRHHSYPCGPCTDSNQNTFKAPHTSTRHTHFCRHTVCGYCGQAHEWMDILFSGAREAGTCCRLDRQTRYSTPT